jgi:ssRNA-specific RNase YbeY (16S rRNA maturation enzyme)
MAHGVLHLCRLKDKTKAEQEMMREEEEAMGILDKLIAN